MRRHVKNVLMIGSGGIVIGQAAEFDYSGSQALKALREEGVKSVLINPNVATIQTSMKMADKVYLEPITHEVLERIIEKEGIDGILLGFGGQTALNAGVELKRTGTLDKYGVAVLGTSIRAIEISEDRQLFKDFITSIGLKMPESGTASNVDEASEVAKDIGFPVLIRTSYTLGGTAASVVRNDQELRDIVQRALKWSWNAEVMIEKYYEGWKEVEYEVMRDYKDNAVVIATMEGLDPLGVHTGDKIVVSPIQTLTNKEYQMLRSDSIKIVRNLGIVGECNIQYGLNFNGDNTVVIELNPRMSRSSALASKATGYPLAYLATKLTLGYGLDELLNKVTGVTIAGFEPSMDYVVVKHPRWDFDKFAGNIDRTVGPMMKSVGEVMAIARSFEEALQKAIRMLEIGKEGLSVDDERTDPEDITRELASLNDLRLFTIAKAFKAGLTVDEVYRLTKIDKWFLYKIKNIVEMDGILSNAASYGEDELAEVIREAKRLGFSDAQIGARIGLSADEVRAFRKKHNIVPCVKLVDTTSAEWPARTNYCYMTYGDFENDIERTGKRKVIVLGAGPNRIGSSVEFDYCTMNTVWSIKEEGIDEVIVLNNNPETVSTDYDMSDKLYFEEITLERVLDIVEYENPLGVVLSVGGQTPNKLAIPLSKREVRLLGTQAESIDNAENRSKFSALLDALHIPQPPWGRVSSEEDALKLAEKLEYPVMVRPSYVLSGAAMSTAKDEKELISYIRRASSLSKEYPITLSKFIENAIEAEVDAVSDGEDVVIGAVMEHIEPAGTHSGDAIVVIPPIRLSSDAISRIHQVTELLAKRLRIRGPFNVQFLIKGDTVYVIEVNLRASRSMPFVSKSTGVPLLWLAGKVIMGKRIKELGNFVRKDFGYYAVKAPTFSFARIKGSDPILGVEMNSTGEVACIGRSLPEAILKSLIASGMELPSRGAGILITVRDEDKPGAVDLARRLSNLGYKIYATKGTATYMAQEGVSGVEVVTKDGEGLVEKIVRMIVRGEISVVINVPSSYSRVSIDDMYLIRRSSVEFSFPVVSNIETASAVVTALETEQQDNDMQPICLNEHLSSSPYAEKI